MMSTTGAVCINRRTILTGISFISSCQPQGAGCLPPDDWGVPTGSDCHGWGTGSFPESSGILCLATANLFPGSLGCQLSHPGWLHPSHADWQLRQGSVRWVPALELEERYPAQAQRRYQVQRTLWSLQYLFRSFQFLIWLHYRSRRLKMWSTTCRYGIWFPRLVPLLELWHQGLASTPSRASC